MLGSVTIRDSEDRLELLAESPVGGLEELKRKIRELFELGGGTVLVVLWDDAELAELTNREAQRLVDGDQLTFAQVTTAEPTISQSPESSVQPVAPVGTLAGLLAVDTVAANATCTIPMTPLSAIAAAPAGGTVGMTLHAELVHLTEHGTASQLALKLQHSNMLEQQLVMELSTCDNLDRNLFHIAASRGNLAIMRLLAEQVGSSPLAAQAIKSPDLGRKTPLLLAVEGQSLPVARFLHEQAACPLDCRDLAGRRPVHVAATHADVRVLEWVLDSSTKEALEALDNGGHSPLSYSIQSSQLAAAMLLIERGAQTDTRNNNGTFLLHQAASTGYMPTIELLLWCNVDVNARNNTGTTALHHACHLPKVVVCLLHAGADTRLSNARGRTPLEDCRRIVSRTAHARGGRRALDTIINGIGKHGLALVPDPLSVMHDSPWTAGRDVDTDAELACALLELVDCPWTPTANVLFPPQFRLMARSLVSCRGLAIVPSPVWEHVLSFICREDFGLPGGMDLQVDQFQARTCVVA